MRTGQSPDSFCRWDNVKKIFNSHSEAVTAVVTIRDDRLLGEKVGRARG